MVEEGGRRRKKNRSRSWARSSYEVPWKLSFLCVRRVVWPAPVPYRITRWLRIWHQLFQLSARQKGWCVGQRVFFL